MERTVLEYECQISELKSLHISTIEDSSKILEFERKAQAETQSVLTEANATLISQGIDLLFRSAIASY